MMKKMMLAVAIIAFGAITASAQNRGLGFGVKAGANLSSLTKDLNASSVKAGFTGGVFVDYRFSNLFALSVDALYARQGGASDNDANVKTDCLNVPVLANFYVFKGLAVKTGVQPGFFLGAKQGELSVADRFRTAALSIPVGVSYDLPLGFIVDLRYNFGVTNVLGAGKGKSVNNVWTLTAGWRF